MTIGDSQVEALQVDNNESFHGLFNTNSNQENKLTFISTSIGAAGMALPNYLASLKYASNLTSLQKDYVVISIQANDYEESFEKLGSKGQRAGRGQFFFEGNGTIYFKDFFYNN